MCALVAPIALRAAPPARHQYLARKKYLFVQPNASAPAPISEVVAQVGGHVDFDLPRWLVITLPQAALGAIEHHPAVRYVQQVVSGPFVEPSAASMGTRHMAPQARLAPNGSPPWTSGNYRYDGAGNIFAIGNDSFVYDPLSRLTSASVKGTTETYMYDAFGNLTYKNTHNPASPPDVTVDFTNTTNTATNHLSIYGYDGAGNLTGDASETNAFDPMNMQREKDVGNLAELYIYDASDERIGAFECSGPPANCTNATVIWSLRDESGKVLRQFEGTYIGGSSNDPPWAWAEDYVYRDGLLLAGELPAAEGGRRHFHLDHLGTPRLVTGSSGQQLAAHDYYPFGVEIPPSFTDTAAGYREEPMRFTGHERDFNAGTSTENSNYNDFMHARPRVPQWGRFLSIDPVTDFKKNAVNPQRWNRYSYVLNNPIRFSDPSGKYTCTGYGSECGAFNTSLIILRAATFELARMGAPGTTRLRDVMNFFGKLDVDNGVHVVFGNAKGGLANTMLNRDANTTTITIDRNAFASISSNYFQISRVAAHEGDHGLTFQANPELAATHSQRDLLFSERSAYRTEGYINNALRVDDDVLHIWDRVHGFQPGEIEWNAMQSVIISCREFDGCNP